MNDDLVPSRAPSPSSLASRVRGAVAPITATLVPGALIGAIYLATGTHWEALKVTLADWGIATSISVFFAPVIGVLAVLGVRTIVRFARGTDDSPSA